MNQDFLPPKEPSLETAKNNIVHGLFEVTVFMKGLHGLWEITVGVLFLYIKPETISNALMSVSHNIVVSRSGHYVTNYLTRQADNFSSSTKFYRRIFAFLRRRKFIFSFFFNEGQAVGVPLRHGLFYYFHMLSNLPVFPARVGIFTSTDDI